MVAITVILAAVIATFILGLGEDVSDTVNAGVSVEQDVSNDEFTVTWVSEGSAETLNITNSTGNVATLSYVGNSTTLNYSGSDAFPYQIIAVNSQGTQTVVRTVNDPSGE